MERGYVKIWRKTLDSGVISSPPVSALFLWLMLNATHKPRQMFYSGAIFDLKAGDVLYGRNIVSQKIGLTERQIRTALSVLQKLGIVTVKTTNKCSVVSLIYWDRYQSCSPASDQQDDQQTSSNTASKRPAGDQQATTEQECKNVNNINKNTSYSLSSCDDVTQLTLLDSREKPSSEGKSNIPSCPHGEIVKLYHETLPMMPKIKVWDSGRQGGLRWCWKNRYDDGKYKTAEEGLVYWKSLFEHIRDKCPWLTGQIEGRDGRAFTKCNLAWIVKRANFIKIIEGNYDQKEVA